MPIRALSTSKTGNAFKFALLCFFISFYFAPVENGEFVRGDTQVNLISWVFHLVVYFFPYMFCFIFIGDYGVYNAFAFYSGLLIQSIFIGYLLSWLSEYFRK